MQKETLCKFLFSIETLCFLNIFMNGKELNKCVKLQQSAMEIFKKTESHFIFSSKVNNLVNIKQVKNISH